MPKTKRARLITLAKTKKKTKELKKSIVDNVRDAVDTCPYIYIVEVANERNVLMKQLREQWSSSKFFFGKNKVMWHALGRTAESEYRPGLHTISTALSGKRGLFCTSSPPEEVLQFFKDFQEPEFARAGAIADRDVELKAGVLQGQPFAIEPTLRQLGLQTKLDKGNVVLIKDTVICKQGDVLTPEKCRLLKLFEEKTAVFQVSIVGVWHDGKFERYVEDPVVAKKPSSASRKRQQERDFDNESSEDEDEDSDDGETMFE